MSTRTAGRLLIAFLVSFAGVSHAACPPPPPGGQWPVELEGSAQPVPHAEGQASIRTDAPLSFAWGLDITTGCPLAAFVDYALDWSSIRMADGRVVSWVLDWRGANPSGVRRVIIGERAPTSTPGDDHRIFLVPQAPPSIPGHVFTDGFRFSSRDGLSWVGLWRRDDGAESVIAAFDDGGADYAIVAATLPGAEVISGSSPLHGGPASISVATSPGPTGTFRVLTYRWRR